MKKRLKQSGGGWEFYFSKPLLKLLGYNPTKNKILITSKNKILRFQPIKQEDWEKFEDNMLRNFQKSGSNYAIYMPQELIDVLEIDPLVNFIEVEIDENILLIKKAME